jgi:hypothetical protein
LAVLNSRPALPNAQRGDSKKVIFLFLIRPVLEKPAAMDTSGIAFDLRLRLDAGRSGDQQMRILEIVLQLAASRKNPILSN